MIPNPEKFPNGFKAVADSIHALGLKSGLYTAKGTHTCAGFAASCGHEAQDAKLWASWGIDYVRNLPPLPTRPFSWDLGHGTFFTPHHAPFHHTCR
jgi:hypothetical protein